MKRLVTESCKESKLLWRVAFPAVLTEVFQFSIGFVTASFVGHIGVVELAAVTVVESILEGFAYGVLVNRSTHTSREIRLTTVLELH
jgi:MATE family multidrug resistance protein